MSPEQKKNLKLFSGLFVVGAVVVVGAVLLGRSDQGQIDVSAAIALSNEEKRERGETDFVQVPNPLSNIPNGGLVGQGKPTPPPKPEVEGSATSTDDTSTSTDDENGEVDEETEGVSADGGEEEGGTDPETTGGEAEEEASEGEQ